MKIHNLPQPVLAAVAGLAICGSSAHAASLSLYLDFETDFADQSGNGLSTTVTGSPTLSTSVPAAIGSGNSGSFDGNTTWVDVAANALINSNAFTMMYFVNAGAQNGSFERFTSRGGFEFDTAISSTGQLSFFSIGASPQGWHNSGTSIAVDSSTWNHIAWQDDGTNTRLYVNGSLVYTQVTTGSLSSFLRIGAVQTAVGAGSEGFLGLMDDFAWFDDTTDPLTATDIAFIANNGVAAFIPEPSSALLVGACGIGALLRRRRR